MPENVAALQAAVIKYGRLPGASPPANNIRALRAIYYLLIQHL